MTVSDQPSGRNESDEVHRKAFWGVVAAWGRRTRRARLTGQTLKVAWALGDYFGTTHGIAYPSRDTLGGSAGVADPADVRKALKALAEARLIGEVADAEVLAAIRSDSRRRPSGRPPKGYRMVLDEDHPRLPDAIEAMIERDSPVAGARVGRRRRPREWEDEQTNSGGTVPPNQDLGQSGVSGEQFPSTFGGTVPPEFRGNSSPPKIEEEDEEGEGGYAPSPHIDTNADQEEDTHAPEGARPFFNSEEDEANMTHDEALDQLAKAFGGPVGDRTVAMVCMHRALDEGLFHDQLIHAALHPASDDLTLEDLLHHQTQAGRRNRAAV